MDATKDNPETAEAPATETATTESRVAALEKEVAELKDARLRALADLQNTARRGIENEARARVQGVAGAAREVLPVLDHVDLALQQKGMTLEQAMQGLHMLRDELAKGLEKVGVERIDPKVGEEFQPGIHEAVMRQAVEGVKGDGVSMVLQSGWRLGDSILRPAKVAVQPSE
jgi:molecular chaperone GrpE